jgi:hypothetical protein
MSKKLKMKWSAIVLSLTLLGLLMSSYAVKADPPVTATAPAAASPGATAIGKAAKDNKYLFIFFFAGQDEYTGAMNGVFQKAMAKMTDRANSIAINVADPTERPIVDKFGIRGAPMPLVLAIAPTGAATRGFPKTFNEAQLLTAFVSPCTAKCMRAIQDRHSILLCVQSDKTQFNQEAMQGVEAFKADPQYAKGTEIITLNPAEDVEQPFLKALQVDSRTPTAVTLLVTPPGAPVARFVGVVTKDQIEVAVKAAQSSCGPNCSCHH